MIYENFFYNDDFFRDMEDLMDDLNLKAEADIYSLPDDWKIEAVESNLEKMFVLTNEYVIEAILGRTDIFEERFPEDDFTCLNELRKVIPKCIDIEKMNQAVKELYYPNGKKITITKSDLIEYIK